MNKQQKIKSFDPNSVGNLSNNIFGLPFTTDESEVVLIPVPWEVTVSYGSGTANGPKAIFDASFQIDLFDAKIQDAWKMGIALDKIPAAIKGKSNRLRKKTEAYITLLEQGKDASSNKRMKAIAQGINKASRELNAYVKNKTSHFLAKNKTVGLVGGDHSTPLGFMQALSEQHTSFGVLQIDAHADLRNAYEGFEFSHASIMYNALKINSISKLVQVGIRDYCEEEVDVINKKPDRIITYFDRDIKRRMYEGETWKKICDEIVKQLPEKVYLSFDIDGLDPKLCPNTGTPVAGGFEVEQTLYLIERVVESGKTIIGFDLNEVSPGKDEWDANVGARLLYRITLQVARSQKKI
ncbi:MAG: agmatinase family protein [Cyclobacteriaceae bacterium]|nr:agmatinase family protein [Cyclobacteriaceae bacterium]